MQAGGPHGSVVPFQTEIIEVLNIQVRRIQVGYWDERTKQGDKHNHAPGAADDDEIGSAVTAAVRVVDAESNESTAMVKEDRAERSYRSWLETKAADKTVRGRSLDTATWKARTPSTRTDIEAELSGCGELGGREKDEDCDVAFDAADFDVAERNPMVQYDDSDGTEMAEKKRMQAQGIEPTREISLFGSDCPGKIAYLKLVGILL
ncbi:hypothetical protein B0H13DRAFT_1852319 [Mycena leptocephala]|nr:hypothetical protein B0H13DRAFT_1852319 [Mycena leptocephala]